MKVQERFVRVGYVCGPESYILLVAARLGLAERYGVELELVECISFNSLIQRLNRGQLDYGLRDSVEAWCANGHGGAGRLMSGVLVRGARNHIMVSAGVRKLGGVDMESLGLLCRNSCFEEPLRVAIAEPVGSTECYRMEFARAAGPGWVNRVVLPAEVMESSLASNSIDAYCCGLQITEGSEAPKAGWLLEGVKGVPGRREMALVASEEVISGNREAYLGLLAALMDAQDELSKPERLEELTGLIPPGSEYGMATVREAIRDVYQEGPLRTGMDPGVLGSTMRGGVVRPSAQWDVVAFERCRRLGVLFGSSRPLPFVEPDLFDEALLLREVVNA